MQLPITVSSTYASFFLLEKSSYSLIIQSLKKENLVRKIYPLSHNQPFFAVAFVLSGSFTPHAELSTEFLKIRSQADFLVEFPLFHLCLNRLNHIS